MKRRTTLERVQAIFKLIAEKKKVFKTDFENIGFNTRSAEEWMKIIMFIQNQPKITRFERGRTTIYEFGDQD